MIEVCSREEDVAFGAIVFWLAVTEQKARVTLDGEVRLEPLEDWRSRKRRKMREGAAAMSAAEAKRARKAAKRAALV